MYLLSVQGKYAPAFHLGESAALQLKQQVEAETKNAALVISSRFRSDLIYLDDNNSLISSLKKWCALTKTPYTGSLKMNFFRSDEEIISLHHFFHRLQLIRRIPGWYGPYIVELQKVLLENMHHPLHQKLSEALEAYLHLVECQIQNLQKDFIRKKVSGFLDLNRLACKNKAHFN